MDEPLKSLMQELGNAINNSLSESDDIAEAIGKIKKAGYDVFLILEATIGFNRREGAEGGEADEDKDEGASAPEAGSHLPTAGMGKIKFTAQDHRFLRALKIAEGDGSPEL